MRIAWRGWARRFACHWPAVIAVLASEVTPFSLCSQSIAYSWFEPDHAWNLGDVSHGERLSPDERATMTQPSDTPATSGRSRSPVAAHPVTSAIIAILVLASIFFALYVPL